MFMLPKLTDVFFIKVLIIFYLSSFIYLVAPQRYHLRIRNFRLIYLPLPPSPAWLITGHVEGTNAVISLSGCQHVNQ